KLPAPCQLFGRIERTIEGVLDVLRRQRVPAVKLDAATQLELEHGVGNGLPRRGQRGLEFAARIAAHEVVEDIRPHEPCEQLEHVGFERERQSAKSQRYRLTRLGGSRAGRREYQGQ